MITTQKSTLGWLIFAFISASIAAALLIWFGLELADHKRSSVGLELAKAGLQLGVVTLFGLIVTQALRRFNDDRSDRAKQADVDREERRRLNEYRLAVFRDAVGAYNRVKTVRRTLRAAGLSKPATGSLQAHQIDEFNAQMCALNDAELSLETIEREVAAQSAAFPNAFSSLHHLQDIEKYLRGVLSAWETRALLTTTPNERQEEALESLENFLARRGDAFVEQFWGSFSELETAVRRDLLERRGLGSS